MTSLLEIPQKKTSGITKRQGFIANDMQEADALNTFMHAEVPVIQNNPIKAGIKGSMYLHQTKNYIVMLLDFIKQVKVFPIYQDKTDEFSSVVSSLWSFSPDDLSFSLTNDDSVLFTFIKDGIEIHLNYYFDCDENDPDEEQVVFTLYQQGLKKPSFSGSFLNALEQIRSIIKNGQISQGNLADLFQLVV